MSIRSLALPVVSMPAELPLRVLRVIHRAQMRRLRAQFVLMCFGFGMSGTYLVANWSVLLEEWQASSFLDYVSLFISDPDIVFSNVADSIIGLLEALPATLLVVSLVSVAFLFGAFLFGVSIRHFRRLSERSVPFLIPHV
jgi:hypothetical protein